jgi:hypothetical protein
MATKTKQQQQPQQKPKQTKSDERVTALSALPRAHEFTCIIMRRSQNDEDKKRLDRICQLFQNAVIAVEINSNRNGTKAQIDAYNIEDPLTGKLLGNEVITLINRNGTCQMDIYNYSENEIISTERYELQDVNVRVIKHKGCSDPQMLRVTAKIRCEIDA